MAFDAEDGVVANGARLDRNLFLIQLNCIKPRLQNKSKRFTRNKDLRTCNEDSDAGRSVEPRFGDLQLLRDPVNDAQQMRNSRTWFLPCIAMRLSTCSPEAA